VAGLTNETDAAVIPDDTSFTLHPFGDVSMMTGATLQTVSQASGVTGFQRPEDGAWDPSHPSDFYFVTTAGFTNRSRLWRLRFADPAQPWGGGTISMVLDGTEGHHMLDNLTITRRGPVILQEDPGARDYLATIWRYTIATDTLAPVARHDPERFTSTAAGFLTNDEESSGIIDASDILGAGWFLLDVQAPYNVGDDELVAGGQLLALHVPPGRR